MRPESLPAHDRVISCSVSGTDAAACGSGRVAAPSGARIVCIASALALPALAGCSGEEPALDRFGTTGELIALSGADSGAANACFTCHGMDGRGDGAGVPRLAGLPAGYLARQLEAYADGRRRHASMSWISRQLTPAQQLAVAEYYAAMPYQPAAPAIARVPAIYTRGDPAREILPCAACHGAAGQGLGPANPPLAGQPAPYLVQQIHAWRAAERRNDPGNVMLRISQQLSDDQLAELSGFWAATAAPVRPEFPAASP